MRVKKIASLEEILEILKNQQLTPEESYSYIVEIEHKIKADIDLLFEGLAGAYIHEIQSKIGYSKNVLNLVIESKGAFDYKNALELTILLLDDIIALYQKSGVSTQLENK